MSFDVRTGDLDRAGKESLLPPPRPVKDRLVPAVLVTLFCGCIPIGMVAIFAALESRKQLSAGDWRAAEKASEKAKICIFFCIAWTLFAISVSVGFVVLSAVITLIQSLNTGEVDPTL